MTDQSPDLAARLSAYALSDVLGGASGVAVYEAKRRVLDTIGCAVAAFDAQPVKIARKLALDTGSRTHAATILGTGWSTSLDMAAFVGVAMARYLDFNDGYHGKVGTGHISDNIPLCLAVADWQRASGADLLASVLMAYEVQIGFADCADLFDHGWDYTCYTLISSALAAARLMRLSPAATREALNIAVNAHIPLRQVRRGELSMWKTGSAAEVARCAVFSAMLAAEGMTGPSPIFEGEFGFFRQVTGVLPVDVGNFGKGEKAAVSKAYYKVYPADGRVQGGIWAAMQLRKKIPDIGQIKSLEIQMSHRTFIETTEGGMKWQPQTRESADHSLPYVIAVALADGAITPASFGDGKRTDPRITGLIARMKAGVDPALTAVYLEKEREVLTVELHSGEVIVADVEYPRGHPDNPVSDEELEQKFRQNVAAYMTDRQAGTVLDLVWRLDELPDVSVLVDACRIC